MTFLKQLTKNIPILDIVVEGKVLVLQNSFKFGVLVVILNMTAIGGSSVQDQLRYVCNRFGYNVRNDIRSVIAAVQTKFI